MVSEHISLDFSTKFVLYMTRNFCKELEIGTKKHFVETTSLRLDLGFFVNLTGFLLIFSLFAKDENEEKLGDFVFFGVVLLYNVLFSTFVRLMYFRTFSKINEENIHKYCNTFRQANILYRCLETYMILYYYVTAYIYPKGK